MDLERLPQVYVAQRQQEAEVALPDRGGVAKERKNAVLVRIWSHFQYFGVCAAEFAWQIAPTQGMK